MSLTNDYGHILLFGVGVLILGAASRRGPRKLEDRAGEECNPNEIAPLGYQCGQSVGKWTLQKEVGHFAGFGHYLNRENVDAALAKVGFPDGNLEGFQRYISMAYEYNLRKDGIVDGATMKALYDAELMLGRDEWIFPRGS